MKHYLGICFFLGSLLLTCNALAQSITLTGPSVSSTLKEGDDFATRVLQNPWDFNERRDIGWEENFAESSISVANGIWSGTNSAVAGVLFPLFPSFKGTIVNEPLAEDKSIPKFGIKHPIDAAKYNRLCYKLKNNGRTAYAIYWAKDPNQPEYWPDGSNQGASADQYYPAPYYQPIKHSGWNIYCFDMLNLASSFEVKGGSWSGNIHALRIDPSVSGAVGVTTELDWVRIVDPNSGPNISVTWSSSGIPSNYLKTIYVDNNNSGYDGVPLGRILNGSDPGAYTFSSAILPPGDYYFYVSAQQAGAGVLSGSPINSGYSAKISISNSPSGGFISPSMTSGPEYSSTELGNPWDMDSATDFKNLDRSNYPDILRQFVNESFVDSAEAQDGKIFQAVANYPLSGQTESDNQLHLNISRASPIDPKKYRYMVYRMAADDTNFPTIARKVGYGWVTRTIWWNDDVIADGGDPGGHVLYEGWHTYAYDLASLSLWRGFPWSSYNRLKNVRIDPLETSIPTWFYFDWIRLYGENRSSNNQFTISWTISDQDSSSFNVGLYYDNNQSGFDGTLITNLSSVSSGANSYVWDTTALPKGNSYYVYAVVSDGTNTTKFYSPVHVTIGEYTPTPVPPSKRVAQDYDGDHKSDLIVMKSSSGSNKTTNKPKQKNKSKKSKPKKKSKKASTAKLSLAPLAKISFIEESLAKAKSKSKKTSGKKKSKPKSDKPGSTNAARRILSATLNSASNRTGFNSHIANSRILDIDFNGDEISDLLVVAPDSSRNVLRWEGLMSRTAAKLDIEFGLATDIPLKGDFNGDFLHELAVFRDGLWISRDQNGLQTQYSWGQAGDLPLPADYDGDGVTDLAVFRQSSGEWIIKNSGFALGYASSAASIISWGRAGDIPVNADYDGDGRCDIAVWRPEDGSWYVRYANDGRSSTVALGQQSFGDIPLKGLDLNGDGKADYLIFRPQAGSWFVNYGNSPDQPISFGSTNDLLPYSN